MILIDSELLNPNGIYILCERRYLYLYLIALLYHHVWKLQLFLSVRRR